MNDSGPCGRLQPRGAHEQACFLADHDLNDYVVQGVERREPAIEFLRARELGLEQAGDAEVLAQAAARGLIVVSHDVTTMSAAAMLVYKPARRWRVSCSSISSIRLLRSLIR